MLNFEDFPEHGEEISTLQKQAAEGRLVHAILITGDEGVGKRSLANVLAAALLCEAGDRKPCGICSSCRLADANEHPDITLIEKGKPLSADTAKGRATIPVDDIREMIRICSRYSFEGKCRVVIIAEAGDMTPQAQNSLLKILEEPPRDTFFILTSSHPEQLLTTVRSRCMPVRMVPWEDTRIEQVLVRAGTDADKARQAASAANGSIGRAFSLVSDEAYWKTREEVLNSFFRNRKRSEILSLSSAWKDKKGEADQIFGILESFMHTLAAYRFRGNKEEISFFPGEWIRFAAEAPLERLNGLTDKIRDARKQASFNVNFQAIIEQLLLVFIGETDLWVN